AERTQQAVEVAEAARAVGAQAVAHGSTGAGNDQVRFDVAFRVVVPELPIVTPIRDAAVPRARAVAYLRERGVELPAAGEALSVNAGLWGTTYGGGWTHDAWKSPPDEMLRPPDDAPAPRELVLSWSDGLPVALDGAPHSGAALVERLGATT